MTVYLLEKMRRVLVVVFLLCTLTTWAQQTQYKDGIRQGMVKVKFKPTLTNSLNQMKVSARNNTLTTGMASFDAAAQRAEATNMYRLFPYDAKYESKLRKHGLHLWYIVEVNESVDPKTAVAQLRQSAEVEVVEVERQKTLAPFTVTPHTSSARAAATLPFNDPLLKDQWHYDNAGQANEGGVAGANDYDVNLFQAWTSTTGANNIIVSVHDQGVDVGHEDLAANMWVNQAEKNGVAGKDDDENGYVDDIHGFNFDSNKGAIDAQYHGTHVAGTIAAVNNNGKGVAGVAGGDGSGNGVKIMSLQILQAAHIEKSYVYAANNGAVISQNSWGYTSPGYFDQSVLDAIDYFIEEAGDYAGSPMKGGIVIFAAGNSSWDGEWYPGYHQSILSVAALGPEAKLSTYSNYGAWVDIAAPGGDMDLYGSKGSILSTIPGNKYAYMDGTSMACPHVSGIAALALANRTKQLTNDELWNKLVTGVVDIDSQNENYLGKFGSGAIDAALVIQNDLGIAPAAITNLDVSGIAQEFATLEWTVPTDGDDTKPTRFSVYYHTQPITTANLALASKVVVPNSANAGAVFTYEVTGLLGLTPYYFAVTASDRWGNTSALSNVETATTNEGPAISVDPVSIDLSIDIANGSSASADLTIINNAAGILRWAAFTRHKTTELSFSAASVAYPVVSHAKTASRGKVEMRAVKSSSALKSTGISTYAFTPIEKSFASWPTNIIGETDTSLTNSAAAKFLVTEAEGFNLTQVRMYLKHNPDKGPVVVEIYKGATPVKSNRIYAQNHSNYDGTETTAYITLNEQLYFENGETFWIVFHVPSGNLFPLGIGFENKPEDSENCFMSFDMGVTWASLEDVLGTEDFAWAITAASQNAHLGNYITLEPASGDINGNEQGTATLHVNGANLINGSYSSNLVLASNDAQQRELRVPVTVTVSGHKSNIKHTDIADYGSVFVGTEKMLELVLDNQGFGNFNDPEFSINNPDFEIDGSAPWQIKAREQIVVKIVFKPSAPGNSNGVLSFTNGDQTYNISLFGVGAETATIAVTPETQSIDDIAIGDNVTATITVENTGAYPLKYFVPGFDTKGVSENWPTAYQKYGYKFKTNYASEANPIAYEFQDISGTGVNITDQIPDRGYFELDMGFQFPFYEEKMSTIYIADKGFTTFDNSVSSINVPSIPGNEWTPKGYISVLGTYLSYLAQGDVFYQLEADRVIIQYNNVTDGSGTATAQMVLFSNGDIRFYYDELSISSTYLNVLIEDMAQRDGILINDWEQEIEMYSGLALGLDYPGPSIVTAITNGSGILAPGASAALEVELATASLTEGIIKRYINIISNDPAHAQTSALIELDITEGGTPSPELSTDTIRFGNVYQGAIRKQTVVLKNPGTAAVEITSINFVDGEFTFIGDQPTAVNPGLYKKYEVQIPTGTLASLEDWLNITYADGTYDTVYVTGTVVPAPAISVDLAPITETLAYGETSTHAFVIENTGDSDLEVTTSGPQWLSFNTSVAPSGHSYAYEMNNDGTFYQWIDIRKTGTQLPFLDFDDFEATFWRELELPFPVEYYGVEYTSMKIGDNGIISFEDEPEPGLFTNYIPAENHPGPCIMPYWTFSGFSDYLFPIEDIGIFYQAFDDKFIITWSYFTNNFGGMGDPVSAQVIFYNNGAMKFQYQLEEGGADITSHFGTIGLQKDSNTGIAISEYKALLHGEGLAYIITPANMHTVAAGETLTGDIKLDATNVYGGEYSSSLKIISNAPNTEFLEKPVELTVAGDATFVAPATVGFGEKLVAMEWGSPVTNTIELEFKNEGAAPLEITYGAMADGSALNLQILMDGFWGPEWTLITNIWSPWAWETPVFTIKPGDKLVVRAAFYPSAAGEFTDEIILTTNIGEQRIALSGTAFEPPAIWVDETGVDVSMNTTSETSDQSIAFNNTDGNSDLNYSVSIDFGRATAARTQESVSTSSVNMLSATSVTSTGSSARKAATYNRTLSHTNKTEAATFVGTGGSAPFTLATRYNAGPDGFNLSHVETLFRTEELTTAAIQVEIRAGGTSIVDAPKLGQGTLVYTGNGNDATGGWHTIALDEPAGVYPNEDFYVLITYPLGIALPQGVITNEESTPDRYLYYSEGLWYDVQDESGFSGTGWLMFVGEETARDFAWISITSAKEGALSAGSESSIDITLDGELATRGDQVAHIVITSNDPENAIVRVPVALHLNEAPHFINVPQSVLAAEGDTEVVSIPVVDGEENLFTVAIDQNYANVAHSFANGVLTVTLTPDYGDEGTYEYVFTATDEHNATRELKLAVEVAHTNRAPDYVGAADAFHYNKITNMVEYEVSTHLADPDGDTFTYTVHSTNEEVATVFASASKFLVKTSALGEASLVFTLTDSQGAVREVSVPVVVDAVAGIDDLDVNFSIAAYPNPTKDKVTIHISGEVSHSYTVKLINTVGVELQATGYSVNDGAPVVDLTNLPKGIYMVQVEDNRGKSIRRIVKE